MDPQQVAEAFCNHYYQTFGSPATRPQLVNLYATESLMTYQGQKYQGQQAIINKLTSMQFGQCRHQINTIAAQPSVSQGILIFIAGDLLPEGESHPLKFSEVFHLMQFNNSYVITNQLFALNTMA